MSRKTKISCDVTREADNLLKAYCEKHERSKGYLIEKMIRKFCVETPAHEKPGRGIVVETSIEKQKAPVKRFVPPSVAEVKEYCDSRGNKVNPQNFVDHYTGNGWIRGKTKVKCWKACVRTWEQSDKDKAKPKYNSRAEIDLDDRSWADGLVLRDNSNKFK